MQAHKHCELSLPTSRSAKNEVGNGRIQFLGPEITELIGCTSDEVGSSPPKKAERKTALET